jgi:hypothetical protein
MLVEETITYLEMTAPDQFVPRRLPPTAIDMERHDRASLPLLRSTYAHRRAPRLGGAPGLVRYAVAGVALQSGSSAVALGWSQCADASQPAADLS